MRRTSWPSLKTHYYGGLRKYQWVTIPLELHGVVVLKSGQVVRVSVGNREGTPCSLWTIFCPTWGRSSPESPGRGHPRGEPEHPGGQPPTGGRRGERPGQAVHPGAAEPGSTASWRRTSSPRSCLPFRPSGPAMWALTALIGAYGHDDRCAPTPPWRPSSS